MTATNNLAASLDARMETYSTQIRSSRLATIRYWYTSYNDLYDFADNIYANITDTTIRTNAQAVKTAINAYVIAERHSANQADSHGTTIFFPADSSSFYDPSRYEFAVGATWTGAASAIDPSRQVTDAGWGTLLTHYIQTFPGGPDVSEPPLPVSPLTPKDIFIPLVKR